ncbi:hypothetical protein Zmor_027134 [Zophobas morio]|uniref:Gustatory receptor n=1 Tax=Zophobas morio TaxID=2755281 RepID=A0AA38HMC6_9CUCU|nr:hypothetical protein Zmor_027134 [Zophobas morio]
MSTKSKDICNVVLLLFTVWKYTLHPIYILVGDVGTPQRKFRVVKSSYSLFLGTLSLTILLWLYSPRMYQIDDGKLSLNMQGIEVCGRMVYDLILLFLCHKNKNHIAHISSKLLQNERFLQEVTNFQVNYYSDVKKVFLKVVLLKYGLLIGGLVADCVNFPDIVVDNVVYYSTWVLQLKSQLVVILYFIILNKQYELFNDYLNSENFVTASKLKVAKIIKMHLLLRETIAFMQTTFGVYIFIKTLVDLCMTSTGMFYGVDIYLESAGNFAGYMTIVFWIGLTVVVDFTVPVIFGQIKQKDLHIKRSLLYNVFDEDLNARAMKSKMQILHSMHENNNKLEFVVCGCFSLDCRRICWMVAGVATYMIYLSQYRSMYVR